MAEASAFHQQHFIPEKVQKSNLASSSSTAAFSSAARRSFSASFCDVMKPAK
jgi:hypothetical protein